MPHVEPPTDEQAPEAARSIFQSLQETFGMVPNIFRTMGYSPDVLDACLKLDAAIQKDLPGKFRELAYLKSVMVNQCGY